MRSRVIISIIVFSVLLNTPCPAIADQLHLSNGDVITGRITRMEQSQLFFKTRYEGDIKVKWPEVISLICDNPMGVIITDGTIFEGFARKVPVHMMRLETEKLAAPSEFKLSEVSAIKPKKKPDVKITARTHVELTRERGNTDEALPTHDAEGSPFANPRRFCSYGGQEAKQEGPGVALACRAAAFKAQADKLGGQARLRFDRLGRGRHVTT